MKIPASKVPAQVWADRTVLLKGILSIKEEDYGRFTELALGAGMVEALAEEVGDWTFPEEDGPRGVLEWLGFSVHEGEEGMAMGKRRERWMTRDRAYSLLSFHPTEAFLDKYIRQRRGWKTVKPADIIIEKRDGAYWIRKDFGNRDFFAVSFPPER